MVKADERGETKGRGDGTYCGIEGPRQRKADPNFCIERSPAKTLSIGSVPRVQSNFGVGAQDPFTMEPPVSASGNLAETSLRRAAGHCPSILAGGGLRSLDAEISRNLNSVLSSLSHRRNEACKATAN
jgi:hypothetical protein